MKKIDNYELNDTRQVTLPTLNIGEELTELAIYIYFVINKVFQDDIVLKEITNIDFKYLPNSFLKNLIKEVTKCEISNIDLKEVLNIESFKKDIEKAKETLKNDYDYYYNNFSQNRVKEIKKKLETFYYYSKIWNMFDTRINKDKNVMLEFKSNILNLADEIKVNAEVTDNMATMGELPDKLDEAHKKKDKRILTNTPLDYFLYLEKKEVNTIIAETGLGKTAFVLDLALRLTNSGYNGIFFSCEMDLDKISERVIANQLEIPLMFLQNEKYYNKLMEEEQIKKDIDNIRGKENLVFYNGTFTINKIESYIKKFIIAKGKLDFIVIDYLQLLNLDEKGGTTYEKTTEISKSLKRIATDNNICILCISQLSRAYQERRERLKKGEKFYLSVTDIKDSSQVEMDATVVIGLVAESKEKFELGEKKLINLQILKQRYGLISTDYYIEFITQTQTFDYTRLEKLFKKKEEKEEIEEDELIENASQYGEVQKMF